MRRGMTHESVCLLFLLPLLQLARMPSVVLARSRAKNRLSLWIDENQVNILTGYSLEIKIITNGEVTPYVHNPELFNKIVIPPEIDTVNLTWQAGLDTFTYLFEDFISLDLDLLYQPLLGIPARGHIPRFPTVFQITIPCKGQEKGVASLMLGLRIFDNLRRPLEGTPINFRLKKQCMAFATSSLCTQECLNGGTCNSHGVCECQQGFQGPHCGIALCSPPCQNNGTCISPATCACLPGFYGDHCEKGRPLSRNALASACGHVCLHGGHCLPEGFCWCVQGYYGDACEYSHCVPACQNGGICTGVSQCQCPAQYSGRLCEDTDRPRRSKETHPDKKKESQSHISAAFAAKLRKAEQRLLNIIHRKVEAWGLPEKETRSLRRMRQKAEKGDLLLLQERRFLVKLLTRERRHLTSKDKTKLTRYKSLIRISKQRQKKPKRRRVYVK